MNIDPNAVINLAVPVLAPLITAGMKWLIPRLPTWIIPMLCTGIGTLGTYVAQWAATNQTNVWTAIGLGLAGIGVREVLDQLRKFK